MDGTRVKSTVNALKGERGVTLVELLLFTMMLLVVLAAGMTLLIIVVRNQPRISDRDFAIQQGSVLQERFAKELRQSSLVAGRRRPLRLRSPSTPICGAPNVAARPRPTPRSPRSPARSPTHARPAPATVRKHRWRDSRGRPRPSSSSVDCRAARCSATCPTARVRSTSRCSSSFPRRAETTPSP